MRFARRCGFVIVCLALVAGGFYAVEDWRGARAWDAAVREVQEQGGTMDLASLIPPPIPDDQNLAMAPFFAKALNYQIDPETKQLTFGPPRDNPLLDHMPFGLSSSGAYPRTSDWQQGRPADLGGWQTYFRDDPEFPQAPDPRSPADGVLMALSRYKAPLDEVAAAAAARPRSRFPINWKAPNIFLTSLRQPELLWRLAAALSIRASAEVASGKQADAADDIALGFRLSEALNEDPMLIDDACSKRIIGMMSQPIWDGLSARSWNAGQLKGLQTLLSRQDALASCARAVRTFEAGVTRQMDDLKQNSHSRTLVVSPVPLPPNYPTFPERLVIGFLGIVPKGWYDQNKSRVVRFEQKYVLGALDPARRLVFPSTIAAGMAEMDATPLSPYTLFYRYPYGMIFEEAPLRAARAQVNCDQAAIACALERYSLDHHDYPNDLEALAPAYMEKLPTDVIDGAPMRYQRTADDRYRLYSIGWNARDDGGQAGWKYPNSPRLDDKAGDWVWQYEPMQQPEFR